MAFALDELIVPEGRGCGEDQTGEKALAINDADAEGGSASSSCRKLNVFGQCPFQKYVRMNDRPLFSAAPITCNVTINGSQFALSNSLNVVKPTASLSAVNNAPVEVFYGKLYYNKDYYYLGFPPLKITPLGERPNPGMKFAGNRCTIPSGFTGTSCFTQVIDEAFTTINGKYIINSLDDKFGFEYHTESDKYLETAEDSPAQDLPNITSISIPSINAYHDFTMYIMFKPELPNSCYVPIQSVSWGWYGSANFNSTNSTWEAPSSQPTPWVSPVSTTADPPNWSSRTIGL